MSLFAATLEDKAALEDREPSELECWQARHRRSMDLLWELEELLYRANCRHKPALPAVPAHGGRAGSAFKPATICVACLPRVWTPQKLAEDVRKLADECGNGPDHLVRSNTACQELVYESQRVIFKRLCRLRRFQLPAEDEEAGEVE